MRKLRHATHSGAVEAACRRPLAVVLRLGVFLQIRILGSFKGARERPGGQGGRRTLPAISSGTSRRLSTWLWLVPWPWKEREKKKLIRLFQAGGAKCNAGTWLNPRAGGRCWWVTLHSYSPSPLLPRRCMTCPAVAAEVYLAVSCAAAVTPTPESSCRSKTLRCTSMKLERNTICRRRGAGGSRARSPGCANERCRGMRRTQIDLGLEASSRGGVSPGRGEDHHGHRPRGAMTGGGLRGYCGADEGFFRLRRGPVLLLAWLGHGREARRASAAVLRNLYGTWLLTKRPRENRLQPDVSREPKLSASFAVAWLGSDTHEANRPSQDDTERSRDETRATCSSTCSRCVRMCMCACTLRPGSPPGIQLAGRST